jgi:hypothetical protein
MTPGCDLRAGAQGNGIPVAPRVANDGWPQRYGRPPSLGSPLIRRWM